MIKLNKNSSLDDIEKVLINGINELDLYRIFFDNCGFNGIVDKDGVWWKVSQYMADRLQYKKSEIEGKAFMDFVYKEDKEITLWAFQEMNKNEGVLPPFQNRYVAKSGEILILQWENTGARVVRPEGILYISKAMELPASFCDPKFCHFKRHI